MPQSLANFDAALKDDYGPGLKNAINNSNPVLTEATRNDEDIVGRRAVWSVHTGRSASTSARAELGVLASADRQRFSQMNEDLAYLYHTIKVSGQAKHLTQGDRGAFARALETEIDGAETDLKNDISRQVFGQKVTANSALVSGVIGTLSTDPGTGTALTFANEPASVMRHFFAGEVIEFVDPATATVRSGGTRTVTTVVTSTRVVNVSAAIDASVASGDYVVRTGNLDNEINGLRFLISTSAFAGVDPATVPAWGALTFGSSSTGISEVIIDQTQEGVETDGNGETPSLLIGEHAQRRKLASQLQAAKRYDGRQVTLKAGWDGLQVARGTFLVDRYCPTTKMFAINPKYLVRFVGLDWSWDDDDGKVLYKALDDSDAVQARFKTYMNLVTTLRNAHAVLTLSDPGV